MKTIEFTKIKKNGCSKQIDLNHQNDSPPQMTPAKEPEPIDRLI
jgi:hypothetical protein